MGNSNTSSLPFEITGQIEYDRIDWKFHTGQRKEDKERKEEVSIFKFPKVIGTTNTNTNNNDTSLLIPAQRAVQKLRTLRHPFILSYLDSTEMDDAIMLVTEQSVPLSAWIKSQSSSSSSSSIKSSSSHLLSEIVWGMRCLLEALHFLHSNCNLTHGYICLQSVFVCRTGDWKFGALDLACNLNVYDDRAYYRPRAMNLDDRFLAPERRQFARGSENDGIDPAVLTKQGLADIYSLGMLLQNVMDSLGVVASANAGKCLKKMQSIEFKKRPSAQQALSMVSDQLDLLSRLNELAIKPPADSVDILGHLAQHLDEVPISACHHKILPNVARVLSMSVNDFSKRDSRETCRQVVQLAMALLSALAAAGKLESFVFNETCLPVVAQLWGMSDRIVRTALLKNLEALAPFISESYVNKQIVRFFYLFIYSILYFIRGNFYVV